MVSIEGAGGVEILNDASEALAKVSVAILACKHITNTYMYTTATPGQCSFHDASDHQQWHTASRANVWTHDKIAHKSPAKCSLLQALSKLVGQAVNGLTMPDCAPSKHRSQSNIAHEATQRNSLNLNLKVYMLVRWKTRYHGYFVCETCTKLRLHELFQFASRQHLKQPMRHLGRLRGNSPVAEKTH